MTGKGLRIARRREPDPVFERWMRRLDEASRARFDRFLELAADALVFEMEEPVQRNAA